MELVLQNFFEEITVWDFSYLKTWIKQEIYVFPMYCPCGKIHKLWLEKKIILCIIKADLGEIGLCHKNKFAARVIFFDHIRQKATYGSLFHYRLMQYLHILYPDFVKPSKQNKLSKSIHEYRVTKTNFKTFCIQRQGYLFIFLSFQL